MPRGANRRVSSISAKSARAQVVLLVTRCTPERLASLTKDDIVACFNVTEAFAEETLAAAREGRVL